MNKGNIAFDSFIPKLFNLYINDEFEGIQGLKFEDLQNEFDKLEAFEKQHNFSCKDCCYLEDDIFSDVVEISERAGFTGGFKVAVRLMLEIFNILPL